MAWKLFDGRSDKYAIYGTLATALVTAVCAWLPGGQALAPVAIGSVAGIWSSLILGQKYADGKTNGATSGYVNQANTESIDTPPPAK